LVHDTVMVTGGAGFIGSQLVRDLLANGSRVIVLDNFQFGRRDNLSGLDGVVILDQDVRTLEPAGTSELLLRENVRRVFHLAALHFIPYCEEHPAETLATNIEGTRRLLEAIDGSRVRRFVFASTGDVYGLSNRKVQEQFEAGPFNIYGYSKLCCEQLIRMSARRDRMRRFVIARLFNTYGPRETNPHVIPHILDEIRKGNTIRLGNLTPKRDYIFVEDVSRALVALSGLRKQFGIYNVSRGEGRSVRDVVKVLSDVVKRPLRIETDPRRRRKVERPVLIGSSSRIRRDTGWRPLVPLRGGLTKLLAYENLLQAAEC
jgi:UDP-glucose 4-epimerase